MKMFPFDLVRSQFPAWARPAAWVLALAATAVAPVAAQETLKAATDCAYFPFSFRDTDSVLKGYEIDLGEDMARRANFKIEWVCQKFDGLIPSLLSNKFDIILSTMSITDERRKSIDFSVSYRVSVGQFVGPKGKMQKLFNADGTPSPAGFKGKPIMIHIVVNLEVWPFDQPMPRAILQNPHGRSPMPDIGNYSWVEYGLRTGVPRLLRMFSERQLPVTNMMNAAFPDYYPRCAEAVQKAGWVLTGHGLFQRSLLYEENEEAVIDEALEKLEKFSGHRTRGWLGPGYGESLRTPDLLKRKGIEFIHDWMVDDTPCWMRTTDGPLVSVPYALDLNDVMVFALERHSADEYYTRFKDTVDYFASEPGVPPRVITMGLHPHIIAVPYRLAMLERTLDMLMQRSDTVFVTGAQIANWYSEQQPFPSGLL